MKREGLVERAIPVGARLSAGLNGLVANGKLAEVRGVGAVWAVGLHEGMNPMAVRMTMLEEGAIGRPIAPSTIAFCPPLVISDEDIDQLVHALDVGLTKASG